MPEGSFGGGKTISVTQFSTFFLRALGNSPGMATESLCTLIADTFHIHTRAQPQLQPTLYVVRLERSEVLYREARAISGHRVEAALNGALPYLRGTNPDKAQGLAIYLPRDRRNQFPAVRRWCGGRLKLP